MTRCDKYLENLSAYLDGEMPDDSVKDIEEHLRECEKCSEELIILKTIISAMNELEEELPDGFEASLHKRLEEAAAKPDVKSKPGRVRLIAQIAAGFVVVVCLGFAIRAGFVGKGGNTAAPADDMYMSATQSIAEVKGFGAAGGASSAKRAVPEASGSADGAAYSDKPETEYFALTDSAVSDEKPFDSTMEIQKAQADKDVMITFSEDALSSKKEGQDTLVIITADDAESALEKIIEIETGINRNEQFSNVADLNKTLSAVNTGIVSGNRVEVKLLYSDNETWQLFLTEVQANFSEVQIESVPKSEDVEYIRVEIIEQ